VDHREFFPRHTSCGDPVDDPDAPTGSGWWHWQIFDIEAKVAGLPPGVGAKQNVPAGARQGPNDTGANAFMGACPPPGHGTHHYIFTVFALGIDKLPAPPEATAAMIGFMLNANALAKATITATYERPAPTP
jgi:hypothetical protein